MNKKIKIGAVCAICLVLAAALVGFSGLGRGAAGSDDSALRTVTLEKGELISAVSATGTVYSSESTNVYSNLTYPVKKVHVSVGDTVSEGDVLAQLDTASLESDIAQKTAAVSSSQATAQQNLTVAQQDLETYQNNLDNNYDSTLLNADSSVSTAELDVQNAELDVENSKLDLQSANAELSSARRKYREARDNNSDEDYTDAQIDDLRDAVTQKEVAVEKAQSGLEKAESNLVKAQANLQQAQVSRDAAVAGSEDSIQSYRNKIDSAALGTDFNDQWISIQSLQADLAKCTITAPVSGTITAVEAVEGNAGNGLLFVIQDAGNLKILTNIKEYDIDSVQTGHRVIIKADATGDREFVGILSKIAPTSTLTKTGKTTSSTDAEYEAEVSVSSGADGLRIGMNTRLRIVTEEKSDVYSVPYEAVKTDENGQAFLFTLQITDKETTTRAIPVETGMENELYIEVSGADLADGLEVVKNAQDLEINHEPAAGDEPQESV